jgi:hypothetical protein
VFRQDLCRKSKVDCWGTVVTQPHTCTRLMVSEVYRVTAGTMGRSI